MEEHLFIKYANLDLKTNVESLKIIFEYAKTYNLENAGVQDPYGQNVTFPIPEIFKKVISYFTDEDFQPYLNSNYLHLFINSEFKACNGAGGIFIDAFKQGLKSDLPNLKPGSDEKKKNKNDVIEFDTGIRFKPVPCDGDIRLVALEGAFFGAVHDKGCRGCRHNQGYEREPFRELFRDQGECDQDSEEIPTDIKETRDQVERDQNPDVIKAGREISCIECDHMMVRDSLEKIIAGEELAECLLNFQEAIHKTFKRGRIPDQDGFQECSWIDRELMNTYQHNQQQFSLFILGCIGFSLESFLTQPKDHGTKSPQKKDLLKKCRICERFFVGHDKRMKNCPQCRGQEIPSIRNARKRKLRQDKNEIKESRYAAIKNRAISEWVKQGYERHEVEKWDDKDLFQK